MKIFSGRSHPLLASRISDHLGLPLGKIAITDFPDGEVSCKIEEDVRGCDVFIIQPTCGDVNKSLMELLILIDSFKRASAERITAVMPYFGYARQDRKDEGRVPITAKLVANLLDRSGVNRVLAMDLHAAQIQGFFDVPVDHLNAVPVISNYFANRGLSGDDVLLVSPDEGCIKRTLAYSKRLGGDLAIIDKRRSSADTTVQANLIGGPVEGKVALIFDDMISTAGSICGAAKVMKEHGASSIYLAATHGIFCGAALEKIAESPVEKVIVTDTIPHTEEALGDRIEELSVAPMLGEAIRRIHHNISVSKLFRG